MKLAIGDRIVVECGEPETTQVMCCMFTDWSLPFLVMVGDTQTEINEGLMAREVYGITIYNADTASRTVTVGIKRGVTVFTLISMALAAGETLQWVPATGWSKVS